MVESKPKSRVVTGATSGNVPDGDGGVVHFEAGDVLPDTLPTKELARLERLGVFGDPLVADTAALAAVGIAQAPEADVVPSVSPFPDGSIVPSATMPPAPTPQV